VITDNESEDVYVRAVKTNLPTLARRLQLKSRSGRTQKGQVLRPYTCYMYGIHPQEDPVYSIVLRSRKMNLRNEVTCRYALLIRSRRPGRMPRQAGWLKKQRLRCNDGDMLT